jgi:cytochrome b561
MPRKTGYFWLAALLSGWAVDFLFWGKTPGISVLIWVGWVLALGLTLGYKEGIRPSKVNFLVVALAILAGAVPFLRREPFTLFVACLLAFCLLCLLAFSFRNGYWVFYRIWDYLVATLRLIGEWFTGGLRLKRSPVAESDGAKPAGKKGTNTVLLVLLGILLALPILGVFGALLSAADPIFGARLADFLAIFNIENLPEYLFRLAYILVLTYFIAGSFVHAFYNRHDEIPDAARNGFKSFMSWIPAAVILFLVDLLFVAFVVVQFTYFFGAHSNITAEGYTYAEYARRGFFELVSVAVISLVLVFGLGAITQRKTRSQQNILAALNLVLICLVLVMLLSSWQRLNLYEEAYGYSRLRAYTTVFIPWLGALLVAAGVLDVLGKMRWFGLSLVIVIVGFSFSLPILNIDRFIASRNIDRADSGEEFDAAYLATLSSDAVPTMFGGYYAADLDPLDKAKLGASLACMSQRLLQAPENPWQSYNLPDATASALFIANQEMLAKYPLTMKDGFWQVDAGEIQFSCNSVYLD